MAAPKHDDEKESVDVDRDGAESYLSSASDAWGIDAALKHKGQSDSMLDLITRILRRHGGPHQYLNARLLNAKGRADFATQLCLMFPCQDNVTYLKTAPLPAVTREQEAKTAPFMQATQLFNLLLSVCLDVVSVAAAATPAATDATDTCAAVVAAVAAAAAIDDVEGDVDEVVAAMFIQSV
jgi:hypothetical protein